MGTSLLAGVNLCKQLVGFQITGGDIIVFEIFGKQLKMWETIGKHRNILKKFVHCACFKVIALTVGVSKG